ncbi:hypothetical protein U5801_12545 [Lamprobacter modestohalophilus]|uniref:hypothetical protein n=1 Tax=Lamprobacter modestohalophilus TaxID=1064514 RepID=UPI002ADEEDE9|nr:hypothetical protein [Lamprobacter modestohalophilus]MEA1050628.1 hypothetical protein [Lamprobacter modestohalophilus]
MRCNARRPRPGSAARCGESGTGAGSRLGGEQQQVLSRKLRGHNAYYGITGNARALSRFRFEVQRHWRKWLNRRSHAARLNWSAFNRLLKRYPLPPARVVHSIYAT